MSINLKTTPDFEGDYLEANVYSDMANFWIYREGTEAPSAAVQIKSKDLRKLRDALNTGLRDKPEPEKPASVATANISLKIDWDSVAEEFEDVARVLRERVS